MFGKSQVMKGDGETERESESESESEREREREREGGRERVVPRKNKPGTYRKRRRRYESKISKSREQRFWKESTENGREELSPPPQIQKRIILELKRCHCSLKGTTECRAGGIGKTRI